MRGQSGIELLDEQSYFRTQYTIGWTCGPPHPWLSRFSVSSSLLQLICHDFPRWVPGRGKDDGLNAHRARLTFVQGRRENPRLSGDELLVQGIVLVLCAIIGVFQVKKLRLSFRQLRLLFSNVELIRLQGCERT